jgi:3-oxoacyl-[acyl-carrier protein] reductase
MMLKGKVCLITGSTRGIGWVTAREFARQGGTVILNHRSSAELLEERSRELENEFQVTATGLVADVTDAAAVKSCYAEIFRRFKRFRRAGQQCRYSAGCATGDDNERNDAHGD